MHTYIYHHICNSPTTDISHLIHLSSGPVAGFSLKIHARVYNNYIKGGFYILYTLDSCINKINIACACE